MDKPLSVKKEEFEQGLVQLINNSGLPSYMVEPIIKALALEVKELCTAQTINDRQQYMASLESEATANDTEE